MKERNGLHRILSLLLALAMCICMPLSAFAAEEASDDIPVEDVVLPDPPDTEMDYNPYPVMLMAYDYNAIPPEMLESTILRALAYTGYDVQYQKDNRMLYDLNYIGYNVLLNTPNVLSGIPYSSDGSGTGLETVRDSSTPTGRAPDIARFRDVTGLDCADFCAYYLCNYLPNIEGVDTSIFTEYRASLGYRQDDMRFWQAACEDMASKGLLDEYRLTEADAANYTDAYIAAFDNAAPGDLIRMGTSSRPWVHYAIYAGYFNGDHYMIHVGNNRGPEITLVKYMNDPSSSKRSVPLAIYHFDWNETYQDGAIQVNKTDADGAPLAGAEFTATNTETGDKYSIGPTDSNGYAKADKIPFGTYSVVETKFPDGYQASGTSSWTVTLDKNTPDGTVTINATNALITGNLKIIKSTNTGANLGSWKVGIYTDAACTNHVAGSPFTTDANGEILVQGLIPGTYYCKEYGVDNPYWVCDTDTKTITITGNQTVSVTLNNIHHGSFRVQKVAVNGSAEGWSFHIYDSNRNLISTVTTGSDGYATSPVLLPGTYYVREIHNKDDTYWTYDVTAEKQVTVTAGAQAQITYTNTQYGRIKVIKALDTDGSLGGWQFRITDPAGNEIPGSPFTSQTDGAIFTGKLSPGVYTVQELIPDGSLFYCKSQNPQTVTVTAGETACVSFTNALRPGTITIRKVDTYGQPLAGAKFALEWSEDGINWTAVAKTDNADVTKGCSANDGILVTPEDGVILWGNLYPGIYYRITELEAPEGYSLLTAAAFEGQLPVDDLAVELRVVNAHTFTLPDTGSHAPILLPLSVALCLAVCAGALLILHKKKG